MYHTFPPLVANLIPHSGDFSVLTLFYFSHDCVQIFSELFPLDWVKNNERSLS